MKTKIIIEDHVVPQLLTSAMEAYEFKHRASEKGIAKDRLETYGLLWGYALPARDGIPVRLVAAMATVETSALRHEEWVSPDYESLKAKRDFFREYWPQLELIGTFHSHPYDSLEDVNENKGWRASTIAEDGSGDFAHWPHVHGAVCPDMPYLAHLIIAITALSRRGTQWPTRLPGSERDAGYMLTAEKRKFWIRGYCTDKIDVDTSDVSYEVQEEIELDIPSLTQRFCT